MPQFCVGRLVEDHRRALALGFGNVTGGLHERCELGHRHLGTVDPEAANARFSCWPLIRIASVVPGTNSPPFTRAMPAVRDSPQPAGKPE